MNAAERFLSISASSIILTLSIGSAIVEAFFLRRDWRTLSRNERAKSTITIAVALAIAGLTWVDGKRVDGVVEALSLQIKDDGRGIAAAKSDVRSARLQLVELRNKSRRLQDESTLTTQRVTATQRQVRNVASAARAFSANANQEITSLKAKAVDLDKRTQNTFGLIQTTEAYVDSVKTEVAKFSSQTNRHLDVLDNEARSIAVKAGVYHLPDKTAQELTTLLARTPRRHSEVLCAPGFESICTDFITVFQRAGWRVEPGLGASFYDPSSRGIYVSYRADTLALATRVRDLLASIGLDVAINEAYQDRNSPDLGIVVRYVYNANAGASPVPNP